MSTFPTHRHGGGRHQDLARARAHRASDGSWHDHPDASRPPTSDSSSTRGISITGTPATSRRSRWRCPHIGSVDREDSRAQEPRACRHSSRSDRISRIGGESAAVEGLSHGWLPRYGVRTIPDRRSRRTRHPPCVRQKNWVTSRFSSRRQLFKNSCSRQEPVAQYGSDYQRESLIRSLDAANRAC